MLFYYSLCMKRLLVLLLVCALLIGILWAGFSIAKDSGESESGGSSGSEGNKGSSNVGSSSGEGEDKENEGGSVDVGVSLGRDNKDSGDDDKRKRSEEKSKNEDKQKFIDENGNKVEIETKIEDGKEKRVEKRTFIDEEGNKVEIKIKSEIKDGKEEFKHSIEINGVKAESKLKIERDFENNETKIKIKLSDGNNQLIKIMPDRASEVAFDVLRSLNFNLTLKEVSGKNGKLKATYFAETNTSGKFLGLVKVKLKLSAQIDPETGELLDVDTPWWFFFVTGVGNEEKITLCHIPPGNLENANTITVGAPAVSAHLAHGDHLGVCEGDIPPGNETEPGNQTAPGNQTMPGNETLPGNQTDMNETEPGNETIPINQTNSSQ